MDRKYIFTQTTRLNHPKMKYHLIYIYYLVTFLALSLVSCNQTDSNADKPLFMTIREQPNYRSYDEFILKNNTIKYRNKLINYHEYEILGTVKDGLYGTRLSCYEFGDTSISYFYVNAYDFGKNRNIGFTVTYITEPNKLTVYKRTEDITSFEKRLGNYTKTINLIDSLEALPTAGFNNKTINKDIDQDWKSNFRIFRHNGDIILTNLDGYNYFFKLSFYADINRARFKLPPFFFVNFSDFAKTFIPALSNREWSPY